MVEAANEEGRPWAHSQCFWKAEEGLLVTRHLPALYASRHRCVVA